MRRLCLLLALVLVLAGCKVDARVLITWDTDGSGVVDVRVALDADAVNRLQAGGHTLEQVRVADLAEAGWKVLPWVRTAGGGATISASHTFQGEDELKQVLSDLSGDPGVLRDAEFTHSRGVLESRDGLKVTVDLRAPLRSIEGDEEMTSRLQAAGIDTAALDQQLRAEAKRAFSVTLVLDGPHGADRRTHVGPGKTRELAVNRAEFHADRLVMMGIAAMLAFLGLLLYLAISIGSRRSRSRAGPKPLWDDEPLM